MNTANRRIVVNTIYMYVRLFTMMVIGLYTSRLALGILGISDYGLFSVVGGVLAMFTFISSSLANATSRFLNVEMGKKDGDVNRVFSVNVLLHIALAGFIFVLAETIGLWYIYNMLNVAPGKQEEALFVFHISVFTSCLGIINTPYQSLFLAHERFNFQAKVDIFNSFIRLGCILMLSLYEGDRALYLYSVIFSLTTILSFVIYQYAAHQRWPQIVRLRWVRQWREYRDVLAFGNWNLLATVSYMARSSGSDLLLNAFFGTAVNGAYAVGKTVNSHVSNFSCNFDIASSPQIIQTYASGDHNRTTYLVNKTGRYNLLLFNLVFFPLFIELDDVLRLWLGQVPEGALTFVQLNLMVAGVSLTCGGISPFMRAFGRIKWFQIELSCFFLICIHIGYYLFSFGYPSYSILILFIIADVLHRIVQLIMLQFIAGFDSLGYIREAYVRPFIITLLMSFLVYTYNCYPVAVPLHPLLVVLLTSIVALLLVWTIGITSEERYNLIKRWEKCFWI